jgi:hypothetical protein
MVRKILLSGAGRLTQNYCSTVVGYMYVFGSGLLGAFLLRFFVEDNGFPSKFLSYY